MEGIQITVEKAGSRDDITVVKIAGYVDTTTSGELERTLQNLLREQRFKIIIDLASVDYISSAGWGIFISEIKNIRNHQGDLKLAGMSDSVMEVYELLEFATILNAAASVKDALALFGEGADAGSKPAAAPVSASARLPKPASPAAPARPATLAVSPAPAPEATKPAPVPLERLPLIDRIRAVVRMHPEWGAWKIKKELNRTRGTLPKVGWGEVRMELKFNQLKKIEDRFRFARGA